jgi:hypothetical protein
MPRRNNFIAPVRGEKFKWEWGLSQFSEDFNKKSVLSPKQMKELVLRATKGALRTVSGPGKSIISMIVDSGIHNAVLAINHLWQLGLQDGYKGTRFGHVTHVNHFHSQIAPNLHNLTKIPMDREWYQNKRQGFVDKRKIWLGTEPGEKYTKNREWLSCMPSHWAQVRQLIKKTDERKDDKVWYEMHVGITTVSQLQALTDFNEAAYEEYAYKIGVRNHLGTDMSNHFFAIVKQLGVLLDEKTGIYKILNVPWYYSNMIELYKSTRRDGLSFKFRFIDWLWMIFLSNQEWQYCPAIREFTAANLPKMFSSRNEALEIIKKQLANKYAGIISLLQGTTFEEDVPVNDTTGMLKGHLQMLEKIEGKIALPKGKKIIKKPFEYKMKGTDFDSVFARVYGTIPPVTKAEPPSGGSAKAAMSFTGTPLTDISFE